MPRPSNGTPPSPPIASSSSVRGRRSEPPVRASAASDGSCRRVVPGSFPFSCSYSSSRMGQPSGPVAPRLHGSSGAERTGVLVPQGQRVQEQQAKTVSFFSFLFSLSSPPSQLALPNTSLSFAAWRVASLLDFALPLSTRYGPMLGSSKAALEDFYASPDRILAALFPDEPFSWIPGSGEGASTVRAFLKETASATSDEGGKR